jgi:hypothetical protein
MTDAEATTAFMSKDLRSREKEGRVIIGELQALISHESIDQHSPPARSPHPASHERDEGSGASDFEAIHR